MIVGEPFIVVGFTDATKDAQLGLLSSIEAALLRIMSLGIPLVRVAMVKTPGMGGLLGGLYDVELRVDGSAVWSATWVKRSDYVYEAESRWLSDPERWA
jgi:hypothetical protein